MGCTACARRRVSSEHSEIPRYLTLPALVIRLDKGAGKKEEGVLDGFGHSTDCELRGYTLLKFDNACKYDEICTSTGTLASGLSEIAQRAVQQVLCK